MNPDFTALGVGGILAGFIFFFYRKDVKNYTDLWKGQSELVIEVIKENTKILTKLTILLESKGDK
jgi:hypothetical protein